MITSSRLEFQGSEDCDPSTIHDLAEARKPYGVVMIVMMMTGRGALRLALCRKDQ